MSSRNGLDTKDKTSQYLERLSSSPTRKNPSREFYSTWRINIQAMVETGFISKY